MTTKSHAHTYGRDEKVGGNSNCYTRSYWTVDYISSEHVLLASHGMIIYLESQLHRDREYSRST